MNLPILELIAETIVHRVARITPENGFYPDLPLTAERLKTPCKPEPFKAIVYQDEIDDMGGTINQTQWTARFAVAVPIMAEEGDETPIDTWQNKISAAVHVALFQDDQGQWSPQLDGLARRMDVKAPALWALLPESVRDGVTCYIEVQYSHAVGDPTAQ